MKLYRALLMVLALSQVQGVEACIFDLCCGYWKNQPMSELNVLEDDFDDWDDEFSAYAYDNRCNFFRFLSPEFWQHVLDEDFESFYTQEREFKVCCGAIKNCCKNSCREEFSDSEDEFEEYRKNR